MISGSLGDAELGAYRAVFEWFDAAGASARGHLQKQGVPETYSDLALALAPAPQTQLRAAFDPSRAGGTLHPYWVHGPRGYGEDPPVLPAVTARWDRTPLGLSVQVTVVLAVAGSRTSDPDGLQGTALRFESGVPKSTHDYDHSQLSVSLIKGGAPLLSGLALPASTTTPAVPLDSSGPVGVLLCAARALYGATKWRTVLSGTPSLAAAIRPFLHQMPVFNAAIASSPVPATAVPAAGPAAAALPAGPLTPA